MNDLNLKCKFRKSNNTAFAVFASTKKGNHFTEYDSDSNNTENTKITKKY